MYKKCGYVNINHRYGVSPIHIQALLGVGNLGRWSAIVEGSRSTGCDSRVIATCASVECILLICMYVYVCTCICM
jgi:hypothetical protein